MRRVVRAARAMAGLDLSPTAATACAVPPNWRGDWTKVRTHVVGYQLGKAATDVARALRTRVIASELLAFLLDYGATEAWIEGYAFSRNQQAHTIAEVGGVVRLALVEAGIILRTANVGTARKLLLGNVPKADPKGAVYRALGQAGAGFATKDESDAYAALNLGLSLRGRFFFALPRVERPRAPKKPARKKRR
jgi:Holliday junction resolvasome RuvABC endonuclease subunit